VSTPALGLYYTLENLIRHCSADWLQEGTYELVASFPAYTLCLFALRDGLRLNSAKEEGWRVLMKAPDAKLAFGSLASPAPGEPLQLVSVTEGSRAAAALSHLDEMRAKVDMENREVRWLSVPGTMFEGFWLMPGSPDQEDLVSTVFSLDEEFQGHLMTVPDFLPLTREYALWRLAEDDRPEYEGLQADKKSWP
jgi:hypothetical protein